MHRNVPILAGSFPCEECRTPVDTSAQPPTCPRCRTAYRLDPKRGRFVVARSRPVGLIWAACAFGGASLLLFTTGILPPAVALLCLMVALVIRLCDRLRVRVPRPSPRPGSLSEIHQATSDVLYMVKIVKLVVAILALGICLLVLVANR